MLTCQDIIQKRKCLWSKNKNIEIDRDYREAIAEKLIEEEDDMEGKLLRAEIKANPSLLIEMVFTIVNKEKQTVPFFLNEVQRNFINILKKAIAITKQARVISFNS